tara:strand:- start:3538 stop:4581 length:1044 start_codon:yes stop_codon:yes gene_type:complete
MKNSDKNILITGGAGYIGSVMTELFLEKGWNVTCVDRFYFGDDSIKKFIPNKSYSFVQKDIRNLQENDFNNIDTVIDLAGISNDPACDLDEDLTDKVNHQGTVNVATQAKAAGVSRYIMASSCSIYGASDGEPLNENSDKKPVSLYAKSKIDSENDIGKLSSDSFCITLLRLATVFGLSYRMRFDLIVNIMTLYAFRENKLLILGGGEQWRPLVHIKDVARAFHIVAESNEKLVNGQAFNVGSNNQNYQVHNVATIIKNTISNNIKIELVPDDPDKRNYNVNFDKISDILGFSTEYGIDDGANEIYDALTTGKLDPNDIRTVTVKYYKYLIEAEKLLEKIKIKGQLF